MKVLFVGGTGVISSASTDLALERGWDLWHLNRGQSSRVLPSVRRLTADINDADAARTALAGHSWDAVVQWLAFTPADIERDLALFRGRTRQYVFISSASAYEKPPRHHVITESTPLVNPFWEYSRLKAAAEERLMRAWRDEQFPGVVVRPSLTYGETLVPLPMNSWRQSWTAVDRMRRGAPVIVPGDGSSLWTITHNTDFAVGLLGLLGRDHVLGEAFHITSDEVLTWDRIHRLTAEAAGVADPKLIHIASDFIAACLPEKSGSLLGDKSVSVAFDNTKIKRFVPEYQARVSYAEGIRRSITWFEADADRRQIDHASNALWDRLIAAYERGLETARHEVAAARTG